MVVSPPKEYTCRRRLLGREAVAVGGRKVLLVRSSPRRSRAVVSPRSSGRRVSGSPGETPLNLVLALKIDG